jgi:hypothetical protein
MHSVYDHPVRPVTSYDTRSCKSFFLFVILFSSLPSSTMKQFSYRPSNSLPSLESFKKKEEELEKLKKEIAAMEKRYKDLRVELDSAKEARKKTLKVRLSIMIGL